MSRKSFRGHGDGGICLFSLQLQRIRPRPPPSSSHGGCPVCGASQVHTNRFAVLGSGFGWQGGSKTPHFGQGERCSSRGTPAGGDSPRCAFSGRVGGRERRESTPHRGLPGLQLLENNPSVLPGPGMTLCPCPFSLGVTAEAHPAWHCGLNSDWLGPDRLQGPKDSLKRCTHPAETLPACDQQPKGTPLSSLLQPTFSSSWDPSALLVPRG